MVINSVAHKISVVSVVLKDQVVILVASVAQVASVVINSVAHKAQVDSDLKDLAAHATQVILPLAQVTSLAQVDNNLVPQVDQVTSVVQAQVDKSLVV